MTAALGSGDGFPPRIAAVQEVSGGSIHRARRVDLVDGRSVFLKIASRTHGGEPGVFAAEAAGLAALAAVGEIRVPEVLAHGGGEGSRGAEYLLLEHIETSAPGPGFFERFGRAFARFHSRGRGERFGFAADNVLGATPQPNPWSDDWVSFFRDHRLGHQLRLARRRGLSDAELDGAGDRLLERLEELLGDPEEEPCLLHGDLWGGNYLVDTDGAPVLIDPAVYYGRREADLAMTRLFGGFGPDFYRAYDEEWPLAPGSEVRLAVYELYHLLNHLNLFGRSYRGRVMTTLRRVV